MKNIEKQVVLLIVEGDSEEVLLFERLRELFESYNIRFKVYNGDILYESNKMRKSIKSVIGDVVKDFLNKNKFKTKDLLAVLHIVDTDGCLIADEQVVVDEEQGENTIYYPGCISVKNSSQQAFIRRRNKERKKPKYPSYAYNRNNLTEQYQLSNVLFFKKFRTCYFR